MLCKQVHAVELLPELADRAQRALALLGIDNVTIMQLDGTHGHAPVAPYDAILVAAACRQVPRALTDQLAEGGRLLLPLGGMFSQVLVRLRKHGGAIEREALAPCAFVPLVGTASA